MLLVIMCYLQMMIKVCLSGESSQTNITLNFFPWFYRLETTSNIRESSNLEFTRINIILYIECLDKLFNLHVDVNLRYSEPQVILNVYTV